MTWVPEHICQCHNWTSHNSSTALRFGPAPVIDGPKPARPHRGRSLGLSFTERVCARQHRLKHGRCPPHRTNSTRRSLRGFSPRISREPSRPSRTHGARFPAVYHGPPICVGRRKRASGARLNARSRSTRAGSHPGAELTTPSRGPCEVGGGRLELSMTSPAHGDRALLRPTAHG